jgi:hypothetical protein
MHIRPIQSRDHAEWLRMRLTLWGGTVEGIQAHKALGYEEVERLVCFRKALDASDALQAVSSDASAPTIP